MGSGLGIWEVPACTGAAVGARVCQLAFARRSFDLTAGHICVSGADCLAGCYLLEGGYAAGGRSLEAPQ